MAPVIACSGHRAVSAPWLQRDRGVCARQDQRLTPAAASSVTISTGSSSVCAGTQQLNLHHLQPAPVTEHHRQQVQARSYAISGISSSKEAAYSIAQHSSSNHKPLVQHMLELLLQYHDGCGSVAAAGQDPQEQQQQVQELLYSASLLHNQQLYCWLNQQLQGLKVRHTAKREGGINA
jgi:hypothetical protein